jgi:hypothetical protein
VFEYENSEGGPRFDDRIASMQLPLPLPDLFVSADQVRSGVQAAPIEVDPRLQVRAADSGYARMALSPRVLEAIGAFGQAGHRLDLSIDGEHLVAVGAPKDPDQLQAYLELLVGSLRPSTQLAWRRTRWRRRRLDSASTAIPTGS